MHITEFKKDDKIWIRNGKGWFWYASTFVSYDPESKLVTATVLDRNGQGDKVNYGDTLVNDIESCGVYINRNTLSTFAPDGTLWKEEGALGKSIDHPSFGMVSVGRVSSNVSKPFFGSDIPVDHFISLEIHHASLRRDLHQDWIHPKGLITEVLLTPLQWSDLLASFNTTGVPCTVRSTQEKHGISPFPFLDKSKKFDIEMSLTLQKTNDRYKEHEKKLQEICAKKTLNTQDKHDIMETYQMFYTLMKSHAQFIQSQWSENVSSMIQEADSMLSSKIKGKLEALGIERVNEVVDSLLEEKRTTLIAEISTPKED